MSQDLTTTCAFAHFVPNRPCTLLAGRSYAHTKRDLAQREWRFVQDYADAKSAVIAQIMARAGRGRP